jgi:D-sedoheptulose 7-phosphate isomerase
VRLTREVHDAGRALYFVGNGGSAMIASHMAADASKNGGLRGVAFNDAAFLTAISNDISFEEIFALPLKQLGQPGDLLMTISSSGNSPNIVRALETAERGGIHRVTLSGKMPTNRSRSLGDLNCYVPADRYGWVECAHQLVIHYWFDQYLNIYGNGAV